MLIYMGGIMPEPFMVSGLISWNRGIVPGWMRRRRSLSFAGPCSGTQLLPPHLHPHYQGLGEDQSTQPQVLCRAQHPCQARHPGLPGLQPHGMQPSGGGDTQSTSISALFAFSPSIKLSHTQRQIYQEGAQHLASPMMDIFFL